MRVPSDAFPCDRESGGSDTGDGDDDGVVGKGAIPLTKTTETTGWLPPGRFPCDREIPQ